MEKIAVVLPSVSRASPSPTHPIKPGTGTDNDSGWLHSHQNIHQTRNRVLF